MFEKLTENLKKLGYEVSCFKSGKEAAEYLDKEIDGKSVGAGGSMTVKEMGLLPMLMTHNEVYSHSVAKTPEESLAIRNKAAFADIYLSSVNGISESGEIINIDGNCNRVAATLYGHEKVYFVVGKNKIAEDYDTALWRARNIAAPKNALRLSKKTPCAANGGDKCYNCQSPERICRGLTVLWCRPNSCKYEVVLIDEELGF